MPSNSKIVEVSIALKAYLDTYEAQIKTDDKSHYEANDNALNAKAAALDDAYEAKGDAVEANIEAYNTEILALTESKIKAISDIIGEDEDNPADIASILTIWGAIEQAGDEVAGWKLYLSERERELDGLYDTYIDDVLGDVVDFTAAFVA